MPKTAGQEASNSHQPPARRLNLEILLLVASVCDERRTVARIGRTCKALYDYTVRYSVEQAHEPIVLRSSRSIALFCRYMNANEGRRWPFLRCLHLSTENKVKRGVAEIFASFVRKATHLEILEFRNTETFLESHPDLAPALASLPRVQCIKIHDAGGTTCAMLESMHWPLEMATLECQRDRYMDDNNLRERMNPVHLLKNSRLTLKELAVEFWVFDDPDDLDNCPVYPSLASLSVVGTFSTLTGFWPIAYPNLSYLHLYTLDQDLLSSYDDSAIAYDSIRAANRPTHLSRGTWQRLQVYNGGTLDLYLVGIPCHIEHLDLSLCPRELQFIGDVLSDARPTVLDLSWWPGSAEGPPGSEWILEVFGKPGLSGLRALSLEIRIDLPTTTNVTDYFDCLARVLPLLGALETLTVKAQFAKYNLPLLPPSDSDTEGDDNAENPSRPARAGRHRSPPLPYAAEVYATSLDLQDVARQLLCSSLTPGTQTHGTACYILTPP
ncbi:hypothetical protein C8Q77DRAFT_1150931 [Trametes polyzona]|nr:hypothetical protein C8Q77DRAFT_1150931 [Trametes polyzona]